MVPIMIFLTEGCC